MARRFDGLKFDKPKEDEIASFVILRFGGCVKLLRLLAEIFLSLRPLRKEDPGASSAVRRQCVTP